MPSQKEAGSSSIQPSIFRGYKIKSSFQGGFDMGCFFFCHLLRVFLLEPSKGSSRQRWKPLLRGKEEPRRSAKISCRLLVLWTTCASTKKVRNTDQGRHMECVFLWEVVIKFNKSRTWHFLMVFQSLTMEGIEWFAAFHSPFFDTTFAWGKQVVWPFGQSLHGKRCTVYTFQVVYPIIICVPVNMMDSQPWFWELTNLTFFAEIWRKTYGIVDSQWILQYFCHTVDGSELLFPTTWPGHGGKTVNHGRFQLPTSLNWLAGNTSLMW